MPQLAANNLSGVAVNTTFGILTTDVTDDLGNKPFAGATFMQTLYKLAIPVADVLNIGAWDGWRSIHAIHHLDCK